MEEGNAISPFIKCGVKFLERVRTVYGLGIVQGILKENDGTLKVIVAHDPRVMPPEMIPYPCKWKLIYYKPEEIIRETK